MLEQIAIAFTGATAVWLSQDTREEWRKWSSIFGMISQPFWFYSAYIAEQWGIFFLCMIYTVAWGRGIKNNWLTKHE